MAEAVTPTAMNICPGHCYCCIDRVYSSIKKYPQDWKEMDEMKFVDTPLHRAASVGNTAVAVEIANLMPSLARKLNPDGLSPLHMAIEAAQSETAKGLVRFDGEVVRVKGKWGLTPLMQCAAKADNQDYLRLLAALLIACPDSVTDVNNNNQTVVHVALENRHCDAVCVLVDWLRRRDKISSVLPVKDIRGNTALHAAAQFGCVKGAEKLVNLVKLNRRNSQKKTALDLAEDYQQAPLVKLLKDKGAKRSSEPYSSKTTVEYVLSTPSLAESISRVYYYLTQELTLDMRSAVLVVATLIIAATYQVVLQPPGGVYPPPTDSNENIAATTLHKHYSEDNVRHVAGQMVMQKKHYRYFMPSNTFAFALSAVIMIFVVPGSPIFLILHVCLVFMCLSYLLALDAISVYTDISDMIYVMALYPIIGAFIVKILYYPVKALLVEEDWWLRRFSVKASNCWSKIRLDHSGRRSYIWKAEEIAHNMKKQHHVLGLK